MIGYLNLFANCTVVTIPEADHIVNTASYNLIFVCYVDTSYISPVTAVDFLASQVFVSLSRLG